MSEFVCRWSDVRCCDAVRTQVTPRLQKGKMREVTESWGWNSLNGVEDCRYIPPQVHTLSIKLRRVLAAKCNFRCFSFLGARSDFLAWRSAK